MSAFVVSRETIDVLVNAAYHDAGGRGLSWFDGDSPVRHHVNAMGAGELTPGEVGAMLWAENVRSVNARYQEEELEPVYEWRLLLSVGTPVEILKAVDCYEYQSCEHDGWQTSEAHAFCQALRSKVIGCLPGYDAAPWDWSAADLTTRGHNPNVRRLI